MECVLFVSRPAVLATFFPGWKPALAEPITRTERDPFTGQLMTFVEETAAYDEDEQVPFGCDWDRFAAAAAPSCTSEITPDGLSDLAQVLGLAGAPYRRALSEPEGSETTVLEVASELAAAAVGAPEERHGALGRALRADLPEHEATKVLEKLVALVRRATDDDARLYLIVEA